MINGAAALAELVRTATATGEPGAHRLLPVAPELSGLLPGRGLRRGSTVAVAAGQSVSANGRTSLMLALLAAASRDGSWCAVVGVPTLGALAAAESGIVLERLALVPDPGPDWPTVVAALIDGVDVVVAAVPGPVPASVTSRLAARARQRGCVLVPFGDWAGADVTLEVGKGRWEGLGSGRGRLRRREVTVVSRGRGAATRPREITMWMPGVTVRDTIPPPPPSTLPERPPGTPPERITPSSAPPPPTPAASCPSSSEHAPSSPGFPASVRPVPASGSVPALPFSPPALPGSVSAVQPFSGFSPSSSGEASRRLSGSVPLLLSRTVSSSAGEGSPPAPGSALPGADGPALTCAPGRT
ncbi:hypothetical protein GCM10009531_11920 [Actinoplanes capillaceus]